MIKLGDKVKDTISGFTGIAVARHEYLQGCIRISVQALVDKDGKLSESHAFDEPQLEFLSGKKVERGSKRPGGPISYKMPLSRPTGERRQEK